MLILDPIKVRRRRDSLPGFPSQSEIARRMGVKHPFYHKLESPRQDRSHDFKISTLGKLCMALSLPNDPCTPEELLTEVPDPEPADDHQP